MDSSVAKITLVESPFANLGNIRRALETAGATVCVTKDPGQIASSGALVLPGVGSFGPAARWLRSSGVAEAMTAARNSGASILGICVGHQLLFESSEEGGGEEGLGFITGTVRRFSQGLPVPQIGWNSVRTEDDPLFDGIAEGTAFYFVHSYYATEVPPAAQIATAYYAVEYPVAVREERVAGLQFHPERSSEAGIRVLRNFAKSASNGGGRDA